MSLNFAPYSDPPDHTTSASSRRGTAASSSSNPAPVSASAPAFQTYSYQDGASVPSLSSSAHGNSYSSAQTSYSSPFAPHSGSHTLSGTETTLEFLRLPWLAALAYALGPFGAVFLLVAEVENDFIRFQAYSSILLCISLAILHFVTYFVLWAFVQKILFVLDVAMLAIMALRAYADADVLDRYKLPIIGTLAESWVASE
ncbi:Sds24p [Sporobolomyces koalae]|uniref:Sds24p n=1 Tax=Sporobolomyces koalae TaxID=500713 RepID=UPI00317CD6E7